MWYIHMVEYYLAIKKNETLPFAVRCMELDHIMLCESIYKSIRERQIPYDFTSLWNLRNKTDKHMGKGKKEEKVEQTTRDP